MQRDAQGHYLQKISDEEARAELRRLCPSSVKVVALLGSFECVMVLDRGGVTETLRTSGKYPTEAAGRMRALARRLGVLFPKKIPGL